MACTSPTPNRICYFESALLKLSRVDCARLLLALGEAIVFRHSSEACGKTGFCDCKFERLQSDLLEISH